MSATTPEIVWHPSPNRAPRRGGLRPELIVLHFTGMRSVEAALERLCAPEAEVSAHYLIAGDGRVLQLVDESERAWHAGAGRWAGQSDVNSRSIGVELDNTGTHPFAEPQMAALERLLPQIMARWSIAPEAVIGHSDMAPARKSDPGPRFDWRRLARRGLSIWPGAAIDPAGQDFDRLCARFGYDAKAPAEARLAAFRARFRTGATGPLCPDDLAVLAALAARWPALPPDKGAGRVAQTSSNA